MQIDKDTTLYNSILESRETEWVRIPQAVETYCGFCGHPELYELTFNNDQYTHCDECGALDMVTWNE